MDYPGGMAAFERLLPKVDLGDAYLALQLEPIEIVANERAVDERLQLLFDQVARETPLTDTIRLGDVVSFSYRACAKDEEGPVYEGDLGDIRLGQKMIVDVAETALIGHFVGDDAFFEFDYPETHVLEVPSGLRFGVFLHIENAYRPVGDIDSEYVRNVSEFDSLEELRSAVEAEMEMQNRVEEQRALAIQARQKLIGLAEDVKLPEQLVSERIALLEREMAEMKEIDGMTLAQRAARVGYVGNAGAFLQNQACDELRLEAVAIEIAAREGIAVTQSEIDAELAEIAEMNDLSLDEARSELKASGSQQRIVQAMLNERVVEFIVERSIADSQSPESQEEM